MQERQTSFSQRISDFSPTPWEQLPDLGLYMDQVLTYIQRQCAGLYSQSDRILTPAMINNYVKCGLVLRPAGKKYGREQLAQLLMLCTLKQAASMDEIKRLLAVPEGKTVRELYEGFCKTQRDVFTALAAALPLPDPMTCAVRAAAYGFLCAEVLAAPDEEPPKV